MAIVISGVNNNDKITASDGTIDLVSGVNYAGIITAPAFSASGNLTAGHINVGSNIQLGNAGVATATTFVGNLTGNVNATSNLLLQIGGSEKFRIASSGQLGIGGANYGSAGQVLTSGGSGSAATWSTINSDAINEGNTKAEVVDTGSDGHFKVETEGDERLRITSDGDVNALTGHLQAQDIKIGLLADRFPIIQRAVQSAGSQSLSITGGSGYNEHTGSNHVVTDARQGAMIQLSGGNPTSDTFGGGIKYFAAGHTSPNNPGTGNQHVFYTRSGVDTNAERLRITHAGALGLNGTNYGSAGQVLTSQGSGSAVTWSTVAAGGASNISFNSGNGIDFSATADGTGSSNRSELLDDYEVGEWTGSINSGSANINNPWYAKIGKLVIGGGNITAISDTSSSNPIIVNGLPFSNSGGYTGHGAVTASKNNQFDKMVGCYVSGTTVRFIVSSLSTGSGDYLRHSAQVQSTGSITFGFNYMTS